MVLRNHVSAIDELGMATERLRVRLPDEPKPKLLHIIEPHEVSWRRQLFRRLANAGKKVTDLHSTLNATKNKNNIRVAGDIDYKEPWKH